VNKAVGSCCWRWNPHQYRLDPLVLVTVPRRQNWSLRYTQTSDLVYLCVCPGRMSASRVGLYFFGKGEVWSAIKGRLIYLVGKTDEQQSGSVDSP